MGNIILIPAYNPDDKLIENLIDLKILVVVVNDGSEKIYDYIFSFIKNEYEDEVINLILSNKVNYFSQKIVTRKD